MAFDHYFIVRNSDLYEYKGLTKAVLMTIAHLIIEEPEEDERGKLKGKPDPDAGWCVAGQDYIAAALGMSPDAVSSAVNIIKKDEWLEVVTRRNRFGHIHNKYRIPAQKLEEIKGRAYKKDETGNFIREKQQKKARNLPRGEHGAFLTAPSRKAVEQAYARPNDAVGPRQTRASRQVDETPNVTQPSGLAASCGDPCGTEPSSAGFSSSHQRGLSAGGEKAHESHRTSLRETRENPGPRDNNASSKPTEHRSLPASVQGTSSPEPPTEASRLETPGTSVSPVGDPPVPPPPAPKLPEPHYSHKWEEYDFNGKHFHNCEFCRVEPKSISAGRLCRPDSERKAEAYLWRLEQEARLEAGMPELSTDATSLSF